MAYDSSGDVTTEQSAAALVRGTAYWQARGFPVHGAGIFLGFVGPVFFQVLSRDLQDEAAALRYIDSLHLTLKESTGEPIACISVLQEGPFWAGCSLADKTRLLKRYSEPMAANRERLRALVIANHNVVGSTLARAGLRTLNVFLPPPFPNTVTSTIRDSLNKLQRILPDVASKRATLERALTMIIDQHVPSIRSLF